MRRYPKHIACLESLWDRDLEARLTMADVVRTLGTFHSVKHAHFTCNTEPELAYNLRLLRKRRGYGILYLALHGRPGYIQLDSAEVNLGELAVRMGAGFRDWVVHFGSCETVDIPRRDLRRFVDETGVAMAVGYRASVDWIDAAALDLLLLDWLQEYRDIDAMWRRFKATYPDLIRTTRMVAVSRG